MRNLSFAHEWLDKRSELLANGQYCLSVKKKTDSRSLSQNRLMWMWIACIAEQTGNTQEDVHDYYCDKFLARKIKVGEDERTMGGRTSALDTAGFASFLNNIQADAASVLGIRLPTPEDLAFDDFLQAYKDRI